MKGVNFVKRLICLLFLFAAPVLAQQSVTANLTAQDSGACTTTGACLVLTLAANAGAAVIQLDGSFGETVQFEGIPINGSSWVSVNGAPVGGATAVTSTTIPGAWRITASGFGAVRARVSGYTSGTAAVVISQSPASASLGGNGSSGSGTVTGFTAGDLSPLFTTSVGSPSTTPSLAFLLTNAGANTVFGNCTGSTAAPSYCAITTAMLPPIPNVGLVNSSVTINTSGPLGGGGTVALGAALTLTCTTCSSGGISGLTTDGVLYAIDATTPGSTTPPTVNGSYECGYTVTGSAAVVPTCLLVGTGNNSLAGASTSVPIDYSYNAKITTHDVGASGTAAVTLPTATTLGNPNFITSYCNNSPQTDVITPTTWTILGAATLNVPQGVCYRIHVDPSSGTNWLADASGLPGAGGGTIGGSVSASALVGANGADTIANIPGTTVDFTNGPIALAPTTGVALTITGASNGNDGLDVNAGGGIGIAIGGGYAVTDNTGGLGGPVGVNGEADLLGTNITGDEAFGGVFFANDGTSGATGPASEVTGAIITTQCTPQDALCYGLHVNAIAGTPPAGAAAIHTDAQGGGIAIDTDPSDPSFFGPITVNSLSTNTNCSAAGSVANPSIVACAAAPTGAFSCDVASSAGTCQINTTQVTANSNIFIQPSAAFSSRLSVTCNAASDVGLTSPRLASINVGVSFTINLGTYSVNPLCFDYWITD
jgi:hypothetical protein